MSSEDLHFGKLYDDGNYLLLEVNEQQLAQFLEGECTFRALNVDAEAVLTTSSATFSLRELESSNISLLLPPGESTVAGSVCSIYELAPFQPSFDALRQVLSECYYSPFDDAHASTSAMSDEETDDTTEAKQPRKYTTEELRALVTCSDAEFLHALENELRAIQLDGYWRLIHPDYVDEILQLVVCTAIQEDWMAGTIPEGECCRLIPQYPPAVVRHCIAMYATETDHERRLWEFDHKKLGVFIGSRVLQKAGKMAVSEFLETWRTRLPSDIRYEPQLTDLQREALLGDCADSAPQTISYFPESRLSRNPAVRFRQMFEEKSQWDEHDLDRYLSAIVSAQQTKRQLLARYTRQEISSAGGKVFAAKSMTS